MYNNTFLCSENIHGIILEKMNTLLLMKLYPKQAHAH